jgi:hypothetical protein
MAEYNSRPQVFVKRGMNFSLPADRLSQEWFQFTLNVRSYIVGEWRQRPGMDALYTTADTANVYFIGRINDNSAGTFRRLIGTQSGNVYVDDAAHTSLSSVDSGFSGKRYSSVISRPDRSPRPFMFIGSDTRNSKFSTTGSRTEWGLAAPTSPPVVDTQGLSYALVDNCNAITGFTAGGVGGAFADTARVNTTITAILYDAAAPNMASVVPASAANINAGMFLTFNGTEETVVDEVFPSIFTTTVAAINYDSGTTGPCTITLTAPSTGLVRNAIVRLNSAEYVRVVSVTEGPDGIPSFRTSTVATISATQAAAGVPSFRCFLEATYVATNTLLADFVQFTPTAAGLATASKTAALNLAVATISEGGLGTNRPIQSDDFVHIGIRGQFNFLTEVQIRFDVDATTNDFTRNYFFIALRQPDLQGAVSRTSQAFSAQQVEIQRTQVDEFVRSQLAKRGLELSRQQIDALGNLQRTTLDDINRALGPGFEIAQDLSPVSLPGDSGDNQWTELFLPISAFQRVGTDDTRTWANVAAFQISFQTTSAVAYGIDDIWVGGTHGPDTNDLPGYNYVYRARNTTTGSVSNPSPPTRSPILSRRRLVKVVMPAYADSQGDVLDVFRIGGILGDYYYIGTVTPASSSTFQDDIPDATALRNPILQQDRFKPWPRPDLPRSGTCNVVGTTVIRTGGDNFNVQWVRGSQIIINGKLYSFYTNPTSTTRVEINENGGTQTNVSWQMPEPLLDSQGLPAVFGPYSGASGEFFFGVGDPTNPGFLVWTNGNDPESASDVNFLELCSPSERLMNGVVHDGIVFCFSDKRSWRILPSFTGGDTGGGSSFYPQETGMGKGMGARYGITHGDRGIFFLSHDGVYRTDGNVLESLTDDSIGPLFRKDGTNVTIGVPVSAIDFTQEDEISLTYSYEGLYLNYKGIDTLRYTLYYSFLTQGWTVDQSPTFPIIKVFREVQSATVDNLILGCETGRVRSFSISTFTDASGPISCRIWDREEIWDSLRNTKQVGDVMIDVNPSNATITPTMRYESNTSNDVLNVITGSVRDQYVRDINSGSGRIVRGAALDLTWSDGSTGGPRVYAWEPAALVKAEESSDRATDWDNGGYPGAKYLQGFRLRGDTLGVQKGFQVEVDGTAAGIEGYTFTANGEQVQAFSLTNPVVCHEFRIRGIDGDVWRNMGVEWIFEPEPEQATTWDTQVTSLDLPFFSHIREVMIAHRSSADITMSVITDGVTNTYTIPHGAGQRIRSYVVVKGIKAKYHKFRFTSAQPFGLWINDIEVKAGAWGRGEAYNTIKPFGDISRSNGGAKI